MMLERAVTSQRLRWTPAAPASSGVRTLAEETPVALVHDGSTTAVMMASPADLEDFGIGFSLSEGVVQSADEIRDLDVVVSDLGVEVRMWLAADRTRELAARRRHQAGPTGCGLCGVESLASAVRLPPAVEGDIRFSPETIAKAVEGIYAGQALNRQTRAVHAAAFWDPDKGLVAIREDVGRHNALDKLHGAVARAGVKGSSGFVVITSRVSVEMVQKAATMGAPLLVAVSAPTALALASSTICWSEMDSEPTVADKGIS